MEFKVNADWYADELREALARELAENGETGRAISLRIQLRREEKPEYE